jgi:hypothetical protein
MMFPSDPNLIARVAAGDTAALAEFYRRRDSDAAFAERIEAAAERTATECGARLQPER